MKKQILILSAILTLFASCNNAPKKLTETSKTMPNVLFIAVDDLRPELGCYGKTDIQSPNIDRLAKSGAMFTRAYCNVPVCGASRASLLTGLRPTQNRFLHYYTRIDLEADSVPTLPEYFKQNGYTTISNGKITHHPDTDAMNSWSENWLATTTGSWRDYVIPENIESNKVGKPAPFEIAEVNDTAYRDGKIAKKTIEDLKRLKETGKPFFLACGFLKPHLPFNAPKKYWDLYKEEKIPLPDNNRMPQDAPKAANMNWGELRAYNEIPKDGPVSDEMAKKLIHGYRACVSYTDAQIGKVMDALNELGLAENTIVVLWGDHGWNLREHGLWCKHCNFNTSLNAPLLVSAPGIKKNTRINSIAEFVDIYPTICELAGLDLPTHLEGNSLVKVMQNPEAKTDELAICKWFDGVTLIKDSLFYTEWNNSKKQTYARMLYNHNLDPDENINISEKEENQELVKKLSQILKDNLGKDFYNGEKIEYSAEEK